MVSSATARIYCGGLIANKFLAVIPCDWVREGVE